MANPRMSIGLPRRSEDSKVVSKPLGSISEGTLILKLPSFSARGKRLHASTGLWLTVDPRQSALGAQRQSRQTDPVENS